MASPRPIVDLYPYHQENLPDNNSSVKDYETYTRPNVGKSSESACTRINAIQALIILVPSHCYIYIYTLYSMPLFTLFVLPNEILALPLSEKVTEVCQGADLHLALRVTGFSAHMGEQSRV
jgi:hypothetical protein